MGHAIAMIEEKSMRRNENRNGVKVERARSRDQEIKRSRDQETG
jgi:hypothetical protein